MFGICIALVPGNIGNMYVYDIYYIYLYTYYLYIRKMSQLILLTSTHIRKYLHIIASIVKLVH